MTDKQKKTAISPTREQDYPEWFQQVVAAAELAENAPVRGCMVIKPWGYALWENIQRVLDADFKRTGHQNAYFPLFIPLSFLQKEASHVDGFAKECAVVTHHRLEADANGKLVPAGPLEEPLIVRPTSETIIGEMFHRWVESWRDLPLLINQWANVVRWEMRTRLFLRTTEFLWQEGHTAHATEDEAVDETLQMLGIYAAFGRDYLAIPFICGKKSESERFPGAVETYTIEAMMQDKKALQAGTSHFLGQNFAKASNISFTDKDDVRKFAWTTSWGATTRLIGAIAMVHGDDDGMILPPRLAPSHIVILPIIHDVAVRDEVLLACTKLAADLAKVSYAGRPLSATIDKSDLPGGEKKWKWIKRGVPLIIEVGPRDIAGRSVAIQRRDLSPKEKVSLSFDELPQEIPKMLDALHDAIYARALKFRHENLVKIETKEEFYAFFTPKNKEKPEIHGGFALVHWNGSGEVEKMIKKDLSVTIRCIPLAGEIDGSETPGRCIFTGEPSMGRVIFAKSY